ncbi:MAG TPA: hypothetical protein PLU49_02555 [Saprospiraceae bacterium]|nr:hypothetical protein [Saprospiraceae bacterium]
MKYRSLIKSVCFIVILLFSFSSASSQHYFRVKADFSFKVKGNETKSLVMGTVYFDKNEKKIVYNVRFPHKQTWVMHDTSMYLFENNKLKERSFMPSPVEASLFNLILNSSINNFGLEKSPYKLQKVEKDKGMLIGTWTPPKVKGDESLGDILIANQDGKLKGVVFKNKKGKVVSKQFYENYQLIKGLNFPSQLTHIIFHDDGTESYQITNYKNIRIDEKGEDNWYRYKLH